MQSFLYTLSQISVVKVGAFMRALRESLGLTRETIEDKGIIPISTLRHMEAGNSFCIFSFLKFVFGMLLCLNGEKGIEKFCFHLSSLITSLFNIRLNDSELKMLYSLVSRISNNVKRDYDKHKSNHAKR